ncbi:MAG: glucuronate isomerase [Verrucomicrobiota bacterium]|nr:glucuronate isomerase [Verrucomicrobiota bacterium]
MTKKTLITDDFLLETRAARRLYHEFAEDMPILDYHCHLPAEEIAVNKRWDNLAQIWLGGDHYKWRAMRSNGVAEHFVTGNASDWEKFQKWAETMPVLLRNPLCHWSHLELKRYFGVSALLGPDTAKAVWDACNRKIRQPGFSARGLMERSNVVLVCTTDDPVDDLEHHQALAEDKSFKIRVLPAWRPDAGMAVESPAAFNGWLDRLAAAAGTDIRDFPSCLGALRKRHAFFHEMGCRLSDHGLETAYAEDYTDREIRAIFRKVRGGKSPGPDEILKFKSAMLFEFAVMDYERDWTQQYHFGALRNNNTRMLKVAGPNTGFDSIGDFALALPLARFLDRLDRANRLARTILYGINPADNAVLAAMLGNFQDGITPGKMQLGSAWWFLDQKRGMEEQIETLSQMGLLSRFVGMLTDSRSFLSYTRHEYFRRILCNILGNDMARGMVPGDMQLIGGMVQDICYNNAVKYFGFGV